MLKHYIKIAIRNLAKQKGLATINILGLSIGLACFILFLLYAVNEFSFDRFHAQHENTYRVYRYIAPMGEEGESLDSYMPMPLGPALKQDLPDVEEYVRMQEAWSEEFIKANGQVTRMGISFADPQFFKVFSFPIVSGNANAPLNDPRSMVLTRETAKKLFGNENPIGKIIEIKLEETFEPFTVTAVAENIPSNSTISFNMLGNYNFLLNTQSGKRSENNWRRSSYQTFVVLKAGSNLATDKNRMQAFRKKYYPDEEAELRKAGYWTKQGAPVTYGLQPLAAMHTDTRIGSSVAPVDPNTIWIMLSIAAGVLLIACINFTTLAIGRSAGRAKEVGIRKVVGGRKKELVLQFLMEAFLLTLLSALVAMLLAKLLLPYFNSLSGRELVLSFGQFPQMIWLLAGLVAVVGLIAGSYPALVLSRFNPIEVWRRKMRLGGSNFFTRSLVTLQFVVSVGLIISTLVILQQLNFMRGKNPGFNKENMVVVNASGTDGGKVYPLFKQAMMQHPEIIGVAGSELGLGEGTGWSRSGFDYEGKQKDVYEYFVDPDYLGLMGMQLIAGRNFDPRIASDTQTSVIINEEMVKDFGWTVSNAVGQPLTGYSERLTPIVIGVVKNFHYRPFSEKVQPQMFHQFADYKPFKFFVRIKPGNPAPALAKMQQVWKSVVPDLPFKYSFLDEDLDRFYRSESRWSSIVGWAGGISIFLACLGLFGLAALSVINRTREIGIRKVLGASVEGIVGLLSKDFLKLVIIAFVIASPLAWYFMNKWLEDFAYRTHITAWIFIIAGISAIAIALITVSVQALKAAVANPVKSLRTE
ncbi:MAG TPA: ABC transporter permease [Chitinophagaceae bacterium]|nr:ABC transporter permease [Chitinophagaceae bacterium]